MKASELLQILPIPLRIWTIPTGLIFSMAAPRMLFPCLELLVLAGAVDLGAATIESLEIVHRNNSRVPRLQIGGELSQTITIEYVDAVQSNRWQTLTNTVMTSSPYVFEDLGAAGVESRFYRLAATQPTNTDPARLVWVPPSMMRIPAGTFVMGSPLTEKDRQYFFFGTDETQHTVTLTRDFYMSKYEVTQKEYLAVMGNNPSFFLTKDYYGNSIGPDLNRPVEQVTWYDATNYCAKVTAMERTAGHLPEGWVYRLPTEAEWEYACRARTTTAFHYGDALRAGMANFWTYWQYDASVGNITVTNPAVFLGHTTTVGSYVPNGFGLYDMHGNVWEWCLDWYGAYPAESVTDPQGPLTGTHRVFRGGSWGYYAVFCRSADRYWHLPGEGSLNIGLRPVLAPDP